MRTGLNRNTMKTNITVACCALASAFALSGCVFAVGNKVPEPTTGRQLTDLKEAKQKGAITEKEYETLKAKVLAQPVR